jgi:hypothetical protein
MKLFLTKIFFEKLSITVGLIVIINKLGPKHATTRDPYQSIDLIEYYKSYYWHKELGCGRQALEGAKVNIFSNFYNF